MENNQKINKKREKVLKKVKIKIKKKKTNLIFMMKLLNQN